jgi:hypothetical protein
VQNLRSRVRANGALGASRAGRAGHRLIGRGRISPAWTPGLNGVNGSLWKSLNAAGSSTMLDRGLWRRTLVHLITTESKLNRWGRIGSTGRQRLEFFDSRVGLALETWLARKRKRGYTLK